MQRKKELVPKQLLKLLKQMNKMERNIICLFYFENLSVFNIATTLKKDKQFVQKVLEKTLTKMSLQVSKTNSALRLSK